MAINFEAANMAGYNNPQIEVLKAHSIDETTLDVAPIKTDLLNCIHRGAIPFIMLSMADLYYILLPLSAVLNDPEIGIAITFTFKGTLVEGSTVEARLFYPFDNERPIFTFTTT